MANNRACANCEVEKENLNKVTSVGNSWIICRSKSHAGRIYYFNTLTGEAAWNLSAEEIEKAKKTTKIYQGHGNNLDSCPEPKDPPTDTAHRYHNAHESQQLNPEKNVNQQIPHFISSQCVKCFSVNSVTPLGINMPNSTTFNPNIWSVPSNPHLIFGPSDSSNQRSINYPFGNQEKHVFVQNTSVPLTKRFRSINTTDYKNSPNIRYNNRNGNDERSFAFNNSDRSRNLRDLRQLLSAKRNDMNRKITSKKYIGEQDVAERNKNVCNHISNVSESRHIQIIKPKIEDVCPSDVDDIWLKEHAIVQGTQLKLNIEPLKKLIVKDISSNWFVVADFNILLDHYNFINVIANSDWKCQLMVSDQTLAELQSASRSDDIFVMNRAHYVLWLLSQQFSSGRAVMGKELEESNSENIYDFTLKLSKQNRNVVLISNIITANKYKNTILPVMTISEVKEILEKPSADLSINSQPPHVDANITVVIPNGKTNPPTCVSHDTQCNLYLELENEEINSKKRKESSSNTHIINTSDIGVQTDSVPAEIIISYGRNKEVQTDAYENNLFQEKNPQNCVNIDPLLNVTPKKREIRLKRNSIHQSSNNADCKNNIDQRQYKWRKRKRNLSSEEVHDHVMESESADQRNVVLSTNDHLNECSIYRNDSKIMSITDENRSTSDNSFSENTINNCSISMNHQQSVTIEETSTSGVISNSVSNDDTESERSIRQRVRFHEPRQKSPNKCVMFEIDSAAMEESLITLSDEWVSRFVQIMEEVLTEVLQLEPLYTAMAPPWTLYEAAGCIKKKFHYDNDVAEAVKKLTTVLDKISDHRGKLKTPKPSEFMEMYSYAIYLIDSLQTLLSDSQDIQIAADSLANLLSDIQNPNSYSLNNSFDGCIDDVSANVSKSSCANSAEKESNSNIPNNEVQYFLPKELQKKRPNNESISQKERLALRPNLDVQSSSQKKISKKSHDNKLRIISQTIISKIPPDYELLSASKNKTHERRTDNQVQNISQSTTRVKWSDNEVRSILQKETLEKLPNIVVPNVSQKETFDKRPDYELQSTSLKKILQKLPDNEVPSVSLNKTPEKLTHNQVQSISQNTTPDKCSDNEVRNTSQRETHEKLPNFVVPNASQKKTSDKWPDYELRSTQQKKISQKLPDNKILSVSQNKTPEKVTNNQVQISSQSTTPVKCSDNEVRSISQRETVENLPNIAVPNASQKKTSYQRPDYKLQSTSPNKAPDRCQVNEGQTFSQIETRSVSQNKTPDNEERTIAQNKTSKKSPDNGDLSIYQKETPEKRSNNESQSIPQKSTSPTHPTNETQSVSLKETPEKKRDDSPSRTYNLRSAQKKTVQKEVEEKPQSVKFIRNINVEDSFFSSLKLTRRQVKAANVNDAEPAIEGSFYRNDSILTTESADVVPTDTPETEPKIIRKFTKCLEFENRLKFNERELLDMDSLDYSEDDEFKYDDDNNYDYDYYEDDPGGCYEMTGDTDDINLDKSGLKIIISRFTKEVQEAFSRVYNFCEQSRAEMREAMCLSRKLEIQDKAQNTHKHITNVYNCLKSILTREENLSNNPNSNTILNEPGFYLDICNAPTDYRELIKKYLMQAKVLVESVYIIVEALK